MAPSSTITRPPVSPSAASARSAVQTTVKATSKTAAPHAIIRLTAVSKSYHHGDRSNGNHPHGSQRDETGLQETIGLQEVSLDVPKGKFLWVTGPSGSGKTTLLKLLYGAERPSQGKVWVSQQEVSRLRGDRLSRFRRQVGIVFQDYKLIENRTVAENITFVLWAQGYAPADIQRRLKPTLRLVGLSHKADCFPGQLSGGEQQRVSIARAIVTTPPLLLADEPTGNLDVANAQQVVNILNQLNQMGITIIVTTHNQGLVDASNHPVVQICEGKLEWLRGG